MPDPLAVAVEALERIGLKARSGGGPFDDDYERAEFWMGVALGYAEDARQALAQIASLRSADTSRSGEELEPSNGGDRG